MSTYGWELRKLLAQRRTLLGLGVAVLIPAAFAIGLAVSPAKPPAHGEQIDPDVYISLAYNTSGLVLPLIALFFSSLVLLPLLAALVAGDIVATEDSNNTLKTVLTRSTPRLELLGAKAAATATYVVALLVLFGVSGTVIGALAGGAHPVPLGGVPLGPTGFTLGANEIGVGSMLARIALTLLFYAAPLLAVSAWGFLLSTLTRNSGAAIVGMLVFSFANQIIGFLPNIPSSVTTWLLTDQFTAWQVTLGTSIDTGPLWHALLVSLLYAVPPLAVSAWYFRRRDVLV
ncbi:MAG: type transport system permease protein [Nocardioidaceae bacterium]|nr:type transport system permease protein [Nocardioidaceae bacterium]